MDFGMAARRRSQFHDGAQRPEVDIGKQPTMERQQLFTLKATTEPDDALATLKSSQHFGEHQTMEKRKIYSWFSTRTMEHSPFRIPWQPARSPVSMATLCFELGDSLPQSTSLSFAVGFGPGDAAEELG